VFPRFMAQGRRADFVFQAGLRKPAYEGRAAAMRQFASVDKFGLCL
jgi:hypothetical protein